MKLELKHLAPYLPYSLKYLYNDEILELDGLDVNQDVFNCDMGETPFENIKPILRPLSDLTKQHEADMTEYSDIERVVFSGNPSNLYFTNTEEKTYLDDYVDSLNYLLSHHFDVFGLIEAGLAIDINTLIK